MLHLILGRAGSGKTAKLLEILEETVRAGSPAILLVPDQFSFESERELYRRLGPQLSARVEVLGFSRLCNHIFRRYGGLANKPVDDTARYLFMSIAVSESADQLSLYRDQADHISFIESMVDTIGELKAAGVEPQQLEKFSRSQQEGLLGEKTRELALIYQVYQALLDQGYSDPQDDILRAVNLLEGESFFEGTAVFVDSYTAFMAGEYRLLAQMIAQSQDFYMALPTPSLEDQEGGMGVFSPAVDTAHRLIRLAREQGVAVASPIKMQESFRFQSPSLKKLEEHFFTSRPSEPAGEGDGSVAIYAAQNPYDEMEQVAVTIRRLVEENHWRYRDFAVICRSLEGYQIPLRRIFANYGIPYFMDTARPAANTPVVSLLSAALEVAQRGYGTQQVLAFAKNLCLGLDPAQLAALENYCYIWGIEGKSWVEDFVNHPSGMAESFSPQDREQLEQINTLRRAVITPLRRFASRVKNPTGYSFGEALYRLLEEVKAGEYLSQAARQMPAEEGQAFLEEEEAIWEQVMELLDLFGGVIGQRSLSLQRFCELFALGVASIEVGQIPQTLDQVIVGAADRIRSAAPKGVFVIGAAEGEFPAAYHSAGIFSEGERTALISGGIPLFRCGSVQSVQEKYYAYFAVTAPSHFLQVSYSKTTLTGEQKTPSAICSWTSEILGLPVTDTSLLPREDRVYGPVTALWAYASLWNKDTPLRATLEQYLKESGQGALAGTLGHWPDSSQFAIQNPQVSRQLFGSTMRLSPSRVERYYNCPFAYFCASGLRVQPRRKVEFNPIESGTVIHLVLQKMVMIHGGKGLAQVDEKLLRRQVREIIDGYLEEKLVTAKDLPKRFHYLYTRLVSQLVQLLMQLGTELAQSQFEPQEFELPIAREGEVPPLELTTPDGATVLVEGIVDRVDIMRRGEKKYVRVVDYKSGSKKFQLSDVYYGLNMQMLIYLFSIWQNGREELRDTLPAGVLYMPAHSRFVRTDRHISDQELGAERAKTYQMSGLVLEDREVIQGMEQEAKGIFIPAKLKPDDTVDAASSVATLAQMGKLKTRIEKNITQMAQLLLDGQIAALPVSDARYNPCSYCDYRQLCGYEEGHPCKELEKLKPSEFFDRLEEDEKWEPCAGQPNSKMP